MEHKTNAPCVLSVADFLKAIEHDHKLAEIYLEYNKNFKLCNKQIYKYNENINLWTETATRNDYCLSLAKWLEASQDNYLKLGIDKKIELGQDSKKELINLITKKMKLNATKNVFEYAEPNLRDDDFVRFILDKKFNTLVPFGDNVIDLKTQEIVPRNRDHNFSYTFKGKYIKNIKYSDTFNNFINQICCNNQELRTHLQKIMGYCISGETLSQVFFLFTGSGSNGKSLIMTLLEKIMSDAYQPVKKELMIEKANYDAGNALYAIATARCAGFQETKTGDKLNEGTIKSITGEDTISCKKLFADLGKATNMKLMTKLILCTNKKPEWDSTQHSMVRRFQPFYFNATFLDTEEQINKKIAEDPENKNKFFLKDVNLLKKLTENLDEFFTWCCDGFQLWLTDQTFSNAPAELKADKQKDLDEMNSLLTWFNERIVEDKKTTPKGEPVYKIIASELYPDYKKFCASRDFKIVLSLKECKAFVSDKIGKPYKSGVEKFKFVKWAVDEDVKEETKDFIKPKESAKMIYKQPEPEKEKETETEIKKMQTHMVVSDDDDYSDVEPYQPKNLDL